MAKRRKRSQRILPVDFSFISDARLRRDVEDALEFSVYLIRAADNTSESRYQEEFYRATVLYVASVIEALCLFFIKIKKLSKHKTEYKYPQKIDVKNVKVSFGGELVVALKSRSARSLQEIPFAEAIDVLKQSGTISEVLAGDLDAVRTARNTQHLYGRTRRGMSRKEIQASFTALTNLLNRIRSG